jgi:protein phosphatase
MSSSSNSPSVDQMTKAIGLCVSKANRSILQAAVSNPQYAGMGTTLVVGIFKNEHLVLGHVGDSRCYRLRDGLLVQITKDHSLLQERVDAGLLTPAQAAVAPGKNLLTRALGVEDVVNVELHEHRIESNDLYLLCTDGLTDMVSDQSITRTMGSAVTLAKMAESLVAQANANGGRDNITALLVQVKTLQAKPSLMSRFLGKTVNSVLD